DRDAGPERAHRDGAREPEREVWAISEALRCARGGRDETQEEERSDCLGRLRGADTQETEEHDAERSYGNAACGGDGFVEGREEQRACDGDHTYGHSDSDHRGEHRRS